MEKIKNFLKRLFVHEDGSFNKRTLTIAGIGAAAGAILPQIGDAFSFLGSSPAGAVLVGALALAGGAVMEAFWPAQPASPEPLPPKSGNNDKLQKDVKNLSPEAPQPEPVVVPQVPNRPETERGR